ncbi:MAG: zf-HC2 domain-containing protein [Pyrinomonadaceae bacterium]
MNCENCQILISGYIDGELSPSESQSVSTHLAICLECAKLHEEFVSILGFCSEQLTEDSPPPNSQALWCRINNIIESEIAETKAQEALEPPVREKRGFWAGSLSFSRAQFVASFLAVAILSSLVTVVAYKNLTTPDDSLAGYETEPSVFDKMLAKIGVVDSPAERAKKRLEERKSAIEYWSQRVAKRRVDWDTDTRVTFDRNMGVIEKAVRQYTMAIEKDPQDEISSEMLDSSLNEKMELLREFSEL